MQRHPAPISMYFKFIVLVSVGLTAAGCGSGQLTPTTVIPTTTNTSAPAPTNTSVPTATLSPTATPTTTPATTSTPIAGKVIFSDSFDDNRNKWNLTDYPGLVNINDGSLQIIAGEHGITGVRVPLTANPSDVVIAVDLQFKPPPGTSAADVFPFAGAACRATSNSLYFLGASVLPVGGAGSGFVGIIVDVLHGTWNTLVEPFSAMSSATDARVGQWFHVTFHCKGDKLSIEDSEAKTVAQANNADLKKGSLLLVLSRITDSSESARFDNLEIIDTTGQ
jgi:hypothetical protein